jgi:biotin-(acetyl-CoA carboxylase) ligase
MIDIGIERLFGISSNTNQTQSFLSEASDKITSTINLLNEVSDDYLSTDYEEAAQKYKQASLSLRAQMSIRAQGEMIVGEILKRIENN